MTSSRLKKSLRIVGIIGDPIGHSRSPAMQNAAFRASGLPFLYLPFRVPPRGLGEFVRKAGLWGLVGFNVTIPHKETIRRHLDHLSPEAKRAGAVNTVIRRGARWIGTNTDGIGFLKALGEIRFRPRGRRVTILGAGGAARGVAVALLSAGASQVTVVNRTPARGERLAKDLRRVFKGKGGREVEAIPLARVPLRQRFRETDLLVNATSVGWRGSRFRSLPLEALPRQAVVSDLVYESRTPLLQAARRRGLRVQNGLAMLLHQGAESFRLWTGRRPDLKVMRRVLTLPRPFAT